MQCFCILIWSFHVTTCINNISRYGIPELETPVEKRIKHYDIIFPVNNSKVFYLVNTKELIITQDDSII